MTRATRPPRLGGAVLLLRLPFLLLLSLLLLSLLFGGRAPLAALPLPVSWRAGVELESWLELAGHSVPVSAQHAAQLHSKCRISKAILGKRGAVPAWGSGRRCVRV